MTAERTTAAEAAAPKTKTLLIADDEPNIRRVLQAIFVKDGYAVQVAENGVKALEWASANPVSLLITDLIMPDMNGVELIQKVKQKHPDSVAIVITAYATIKTCVDAMRYGASDYITKPFDMDEIRAVVKRGSVPSLLEQARASIPSSWRTGTARCCLHGPRERGGSEAVPSAGRSMMLRAVRSARADTRTDFLSGVS